MNLNEIGLLRRVTNKEAIARFWSHVVILDAEGCWEWIGAKANKRGYGRMSYKNRKHRAHRLSWRINVGDIPSGLAVCHHCDNTTCVNPSHLFLGTQNDNMKDAIQKGRLLLPPRKLGEQHGRSKLTVQDVLEIRKIHPRLSYTQLGKIYGVSHAQIGRIVNNEQWGHLSTKKSADRALDGLESPDSAPTT